MKRVICALLVALLVFGCMFTFTACSGESGEQEETKNQKPEIPAGYAEYQNDALSFAYPEGWTKQDGSITMLIDSVSGNNINVVFEAKTDMYENMTVESFNTTVKPVYEAMGMAVSNVEIGKTTTNNLSLVKISYVASVAGVSSMNQTQYITTIGDSTYTITITEMTKDAALVATVLDTLYSLK